MKGGEEFRNGNGFELEMSSSSSDEGSRERLEPDLDPSPALVRLLRWLPRAESRCMWNSGCLLREDLSGTCTFFLDPDRLLNLSMLGGWIHSLSTVGSLSCFK